MAWINPITWITGKLVTASDMNSIRDNLNELWKGTATGDLQYYLASNQQARIPIGEENSILTVKSGKPSWVGASYCAISRDGVQAIPSATATFIDKFDLEHTDTDSYHEGMNNYVTIPYNGLYHVWGYGYFDGHTSTSTLRQMLIDVNGATTAGSSTVQDNAVQATHVMVSMVSLLYAGNIVKLQVQQRSGGNLNINSVKLSVARIR